MKNLVYIFVLGLLAKSSLSSALCPAQPCSLYDPQFSQCSARNLQGTYDTFSGGIPEVNLPSFDPYYVNKLSLHQDDAAAKVDIAMSNLKIKGTKNIQFQSNTYNLNNMTSTTEAFMPEIVVTGDYNAKGRILQLVGLNERGQFTAVLRNSQFTFETSVNYYEKYGSSYANILKLKADYQPESIDLKTNQLTSGLLLTLGNTLNALLGDHAMELNEALKPAITDVLSQYLTDSVGTVFSYVPLKCFVYDLPLAY